MSDNGSAEDRRQHERKVFKNESAGVSFRVAVADQHTDITSVHDASISGIRLGLARDLVVDQTVTFLVRDEDFDLALDGIVRWVKPCQNGDGGEYGIEFDTNDMDANILFFMSLRKYLDGFDDVPDEEK